MINNDLDLAPWRRELLARGRVQVRDFLQPDAAARLHACLRDEVPWIVGERNQPDRPAPAFGAPDPALQDAYARAADGFHFAYDRYLMVEALKAGRDPGLVLHSVLAFFNGPQFLEFIRWFGNDPSINMVGAQATRYRHGEFLRQHDDRHEDEGRRYAYVLNLSREWEADWGGLLQFVDARGNVIDTFVPRFNSLSLFKVPAGHIVTTVAPWAKEPRLAITGWWHAKA
ncbi:MAG TPA: 2OG-Fe(II) oxygenase family protein [Xanthomonadaceae bacterium]|nr:2OG-Fe(II) oxygenase family protein [Xanthomonadaceae bacterium]